MRLKHALKTFGEGIRLLFVPTSAFLPELCVQRIREAIRRETIVMPDFTVWTNRNHLDVYLSHDDLIALGGLEDHLARRLETAAVDFCRSEDIRNPYGRFELYLRSHKDLRPGEVYVDTGVDTGIPKLPLDQPDMPPIQVRTILMNEPGLNHTELIGDTRGKPEN
jgi:hypothetical protein